MSDPVIRIENLSKKYIIDRQKEERYSTLRDAIVSGVNNLIRPIVDRQFEPKINLAHEEFWALKDVSFDIQPGDRVGIIGRNGAGKSTLLKILSRITEPTHGKIHIKGKVASLLEVGTGFHPELTGRENIFLNGAILGMSKLEIDRKFDEIVDFAEVERFIDTPVKRYSSGMYVRLAFAVAANLEPEILIVDEVLAVGDAQFQKKCLGKMQSISQGEGRTVIFVSHSMDAVQSLCSHCILLDRGKSIAYGKTASIVPLYLANNLDRAAPKEWIDLANSNRSGNGKVRFLAVCYSSLKMELSFQPYSEGPIEFLLDIESSLSQSVGSLSVSIWSQTGTVLINADSIILDREISLSNGRNRLRLKIDRLHLKPGIYAVGLWIDEGSGRDPFDYVEQAFEIEVVSSIDNKSKKISTLGCVSCDFTLEEVKLGHI